MRMTSTILLLSPCPNWNLWWCVWQVHCPCFFELLYKETANENFFARNCKKTAYEYNSMENV